MVEKRRVPQGKKERERERSEVGEKESKYK